jgi:hypothetical protein
MNVSCWIYPAVVCISPSIRTSQADPKETLVGRCMRPDVAHFEGFRGES